MSSVQFNLLPDVKLEFDKAQRAKRIVYTLSIVATAAVLATFVISFLSVNVLQKKLLNDANNNITTYSQKLKGIPNLDKVLTIQNQLNSLPALHQKKHIISRLFTYLPQITPVKINIGKLTMDNTANTLSLSGTADSVENINRFVDTLKFTSYILPGQLDEAKCGSASGKWNADKQICTKPAFSNVILTKVDRNDTAASYTIDTAFDAALFDATQTITLSVPQETTTRSVINTPDANSTLFNGQTGNKQGTQ